MKSLNTRVKPSNYWCTPFCQKCSNYQVRFSWQTNLVKISINCFVNILWNVVKLTKQMTRMKLSSQDKKDLDKFTKFWALKSTQVIVQSRLGEKTSTACIPNNSGTNWVSLQVLCYLGLFEGKWNIKWVNVIYLKICMENQSWFSKTSNNTR